MTEFHADSLKASVNGYVDLFNRARAANDWGAAEKSLLKQLHAIDIVIREAVGARIELDALAAELLAYRPTRSGRPAAPIIDGYTYVFTAKSAWVCAAVELRKVAYINAGAGYTQEHYVPDVKTLCGKKTNYPVNERFDSGGWPRMHEMCVDCTRILSDACPMAFQALETQKEVNP